MDGPDLLISSVLVASALGLCGLANWQLRRPIDRRLWPHLPWLGIQYVTLLLFLVFAAHLVSLVSGRHFSGRNNY